MMIEELINNFIKNQTNENFSNLIEALIDTNVILLSSKLDGDIKQLNDNGFTPLLLSDKEGKNFIPLFTAENEIKGEEVVKLNKVNYVFKVLCNESLINNDYVEGFILNPFTNGLKLPKPVIEIVYKYVNEELVN